MEGSVGREPGQTNSGTTTCPFCSAAVRLYVARFHYGVCLWVFHERTTGVGFQIHLASDDGSALSASGFAVRELYAAVYGSGAGGIGYATSSDEDVADMVDP